MFFIGWLACGVVEPDRCETDAQCVDTFGWGHVCGEEGSCLALEAMDGCGSAWPADLWESRADYRGAIVLGSIIEAETFGLERDAVRLAVDQLNDLGGIGGRPVGVLECDPGALDDERSERLSAIASFLGGEVGTQAFIGPISSSDARLVSVAQPDVVLVSPGASAISLEAAAGRRVWRTVPSDADLAQAVVRDLLEEGLDGVAVVHSREEGQSELAEALGSYVAEAAADNPTLRAELLPFGVPTERDAQLVEAAYANTAAVLLLSEDPQDYVDMLLAASAIPEYEDLVIYVGPAAYRPSLLAEASQAEGLFDNLRGVRSATRQGAVADVFRASFSSAYDGASPDGSPYAGQAYDSAWSVFSGLLWSGMRHGEATSDGLAEGLDYLSFGVPVSLGPAGWTDLVERFGAVESVDLDGASSPLDFDLESRAIRGPVAIWTVQDGAFVTAREYAF